MLIDTHAHLNFQAYDDDRDEVIERCQKKGMSVINVGAQLATSQAAVKLADVHENFYAAIGLHPLHVFDEEFNRSDYQPLINDKVAAVGEIGFDYYHPTFNRAGAESQPIDRVIEKQKEVFIRQIKFAKENDLAVICHGRNSSASLGAGSLDNVNKYFGSKDVYQDILNILKAENVKRAVLHCFGGDLPTAQEIVSHGYYIGIDGPVTFTKKAEELQRIAKEIPLDKILIETDCPYLTPEPHRGQRNEPAYVEYVAEKIAELKNLTKEEVINQTWQNAKNLFRL